MLTFDYDFRIEKSKWGYAKHFQMRLKTAAFYANIRSLVSQVAYADVLHMRLKDVH